MPQRFETPDGVVIDSIGLPAALQRWILKDSYDHPQDERTYSVTELIQAPGLTRLRRRHKHETEAQIEDLLWLAFGRSVHDDIYETGAEDMAEDRITTEFAGYRITGKPDLVVKEGERYLRYVLYDWKVTSVWKVKNREFDDWFNQVQLYAWLLRRERNIQVREAAVYAILRDWSKGWLRREKNYPPKQIERINVPLVAGTDGLERWLKERLDALERMKDVPDEEIEICSMKERWERRPGNPVRCKDYCSVAKWCPFGKKYAKEA